MSDEERLKRMIGGTDPLPAPGEWARRRAMLSARIAREGARRSSSAWRPAAAAGVLLAAGISLRIWRPDPRPEPSAECPRQAIALIQAAGSWIEAVPTAASSAAAAADLGSILSLFRERIETAARKRIARTVEEVKTRVGMASGTEQLSL